MEYTYIPTRIKREMVRFGVHFDQKDKLLGLLEEDWWLRRDKLSGLLEEDCWPCILVNRLFLVHPK